MVGIRENEAARIELITQKYLRRYPSSKRARSWAGSMVYICTENGVWRENAEGYTFISRGDAWLLPFEEAQNKVAHCGPEKRASFIRMLPVQGSGPVLADANPKETPR